MSFAIMFSNANKYVFVVIITDEFPSKRNTVQGQKLMFTLQFSTMHDYDNSVKM